MVTYALFFASAIAGLVMIAAGVWGGVRLMSERRQVRIPLRYYAIVIGMIGSGIGLLGIAQALRLLIWIYGSLGSDVGDFD
jgi:hypothetical protein